MRVASDLSKKAGSEFVLEFELMKTFSILQNLPKISLINVVKRLIKEELGGQSSERKDVASTD